MVGDLLVVDVFVVKGGCGGVLLVVKNVGVMNVMIWECGCDELIVYNVNVMSGVVWVLFDGMLLSVNMYGGMMVIGGVVGMFDGY